MPSSSAHWVSGQDDVGELRGLARHEVGDDEQVEGLEPSRDRTRVRGADDRVAAVHEQRP